MDGQAILAMLKIPMESMPEGLFLDKPISEDERLQKQCDSFNAAEGTLQGYDCHECKNRGHTLIAKNGSIVMRMCKCGEMRKTLDNIKKSGLAETVNRYTFESYYTNDQWQLAVKQTAIAFTKDSNKWFFIGGQSGCGKTHICTAICNEFLGQNMPVKYMLWRDEVVRILANTTNDDERQELVKPIKTATVLYIDDFFKRRAGEKPTAGEINLAFELLNYRYINRELITIISSELSINDISSIDEAIGGRIYEMTAPKYLVTVPKDKNKNYRLGGAK